MVKGLHGEGLPSKVYPDKDYCSEANRQFPGRNGIPDGIMRKDQIYAKLTDSETKRNRWIAKLRHKIEQYFGLSKLHHTQCVGGHSASRPWSERVAIVCCGLVALNMKRVILNAKGLAAV
jgi:hypothetical protein